MSNDSDKNIVPSEKSELSRYSSDLIKRGLDLANKSQSVNGKVLQLPQVSIIQSEAEELWKCGYEKFGRGDYQGAVEDYTRILQIDHSSTKAYHMRGLARESLGDKQGAIDDYTQEIEEYTQALRTNSNNTDAYHSRGHARKSLGDKQGAIDDYTQAIRVDPNNTDAYHSRGLARESWVRSKVVGCGVKL